MNGEELKKRREELGLSLTEVSLVTKISLRVLHAIEAMDKAQLPAGIFLKGLVKSYALHLKLDADSVTKNYLAVLNPAPPTPVAPIGETNSAATAEVVEHRTQFEKTKEKPSEMAAASKIPSTPFKIPIQALGIGAAIILVVVLLIVGQKMNSYKTEAEVTITQTPDQQKAAVPAATSETTTNKPEEKPAQEKMAEGVAGNSTVPAIIPMLQGASSEKPADSFVATPAQQPFPVPIPGTAVTTPPAEEVAKVEPPVPSQAPAAPSPPSTPAVASPAPASTTVAKVETTATAQPKQLIFEALDKVNIVIKKGGQQYRVSLQPDEIHTVNYSDTIEVEVSDGGAVNLIQNGHDNGVAGDLGKPKKMSL